MDTAVLSEQVQQAVRECGQLILNAERTDDMVSSKEGHANFVTTYDKMVQEELMRKLLSFVPGAKFFGEEDGQQPEEAGKGYVFIVDPIDGTINFIKDYKASSISVCLALDGERLLGVVYNPYLDEMFSAIKGCGAYVNGKPIHVSSTPMEHALILFGTAPYDQTLAKKSFETAYEYFQKAADIRRSGSAALDLCSIAAGRAELFFELKLQPWDYAAGSLMIEEAGGIVTTMQGEPVEIDQPCSILASSFKIREEL